MPLRDENDMRSIDVFEWEEQQDRLYCQNEARMQRARFDEYDGDAGRCKTCRRFIPHEDEVYCAECEDAKKGFVND